MNARIPSQVTRLPLWQIDVAGTALVCLFAAVWYLAGLRPLAQAQAARTAMESELAAQEAIAQDKVKLAATQEREIQRAQGEIAASALQVQRVDQINSHVSELEEAAATSGLRVDEIKPSQATALLRFTTVPIRMSGVGDYGAVTLFFRTLRIKFRDTGVTGFRLQLSPAAGGEQATELRFELDLVWYAEPKLPAAKK